eukprot:1641358-Rhodomonas_salina.2
MVTLQSRYSHVTVTLRSRYLLGEDMLAEHAEQGAEEHVTLKQHTLAQYRTSRSRGGRAYAMPVPDSAVARCAVSVPTLRNQIHSWCILYGKRG